MELQELDSLSCVCVCYNAPYNIVLYYIVSYRTVLYYIV